MESSRRKKNRASRLLAVSMCVTMIAMGIQMIPSASAKGGGGGLQFIHYDGPDVAIKAGWNLITPLCIPKLLDNNHTFYPEDWCDNMYDSNGIVHGNWITKLQWIVNGNMFEWNHVTRTFNILGPFIIDGNQAYWVCATYDGFLPLHSDRGFNGWIPIQYNQLLNSGIIHSQVGPMIPFTAPSGPPPYPPPPFQQYIMMASQYRAYIYDVNSNPYTGALVLCMWNETTEAWMIYDSGDPGTDFVAYSNTWPDGSMMFAHRGLDLWLPNAGCYWHTHLA